MEAKAEILVNEYVELLKNREQLFELQDKYNRMKEYVLESNVNDYRARQENGHIYGKFDFMFEDRTIIELLNCGITLDEIKSFAIRYKNHLEANKE